MPSAGVPLGIIAAAKPSTSPFDPLGAITWEAVYWASDPGWTPPADGAAVTTWDDGSANARDITQATSAQRPVYRASVSALGNRPAVEFAKASTHMLGRAGFTVAQPLTVVAVLSDWSTTGPGDADRLVSAGSGFLQAGHGYPGTNDLVMYANGADFRSAGDTVGTTGGHLVLWLYNGASSKTSDDGTALTTVSATPGNSGIGGADFTVGARQDGWRPSSMKLAFLGVYSGDLSADGSYAAFKSWVASYYGLTIS